MANLEKLVECVPNFSEGRDKRVLDAIADAIRSVSGVQLLDVDPGADTNRTVVTFVGPPSAAEEAAFAAIRTAAQLIDMRHHKGEHPRMGATDVCPFIPLQNVTVEECVEMAERLGARVASELDIPVYLYEYAARSQERRNLANIRSGEYEGLQHKMSDPNWWPDCEAPYNERSGATAIGVREFLIAYNINLNTTDKKLAHDIALSIRETGRLRRDDKGEIVRDPQGNPLREPGKLQNVKAVGWYIEHYRQAQVSINLTNFNVTSPHQVYEAVRQEAEKRGLLVTGSELVGLIPLEALRRAGRFYLEKQGKSSGVPEEYLVEMAIRSLGLDQLAPFDPLQRIIEYRFRPPGGPLVSLGLNKFVDVLSTDSPAPGGGSAAAAAGAIGAALSSMVANLTANTMTAPQKRQADGADKFARMSELAEQSQRLKETYLSAIDEDTEAFNQLMAAMRAKASTPEEKRRAVEEATRGAIEVPMRTLEQTLPLLELAVANVKQGNPASCSDAGTAAAMAWCAALGGYYNVRINLQGTEDGPYRSQTRDKAERLLDAARSLAAEAERLMGEKFAAAAAPEPAASRTPASR